MSDYTPEIGHRVRVVIEGVVTSINPSDYGTGAAVDAGSGRPFHLAVDKGDTVTFERLPDPEPEWQKADVVRDSNGNTFIRRHPDADFEWRNAHNEDVYRDTEVARPLTPLVRNGKPWAETTGGAA